MGFDITAISETVTAVTADKITIFTLQSLLDVSRSSEASDAFIEALVARRQAPKVAREDAVSRAMTDLEAVAEKSEVIACVLMAHLWPLANDLCLHDVCDAIDLWITHFPTAPNELNRRLEQLAVNHPHDGVRRHYLQLVRS